ncbi:hypothetical protein PENTCL1PPCAC_7406, partial [Pristionchus entomophagus]
SIPSGFSLLFRLLTPSSTDFFLHSMGSFSSKPLSTRRSLDRDSFVLCDGFARLRNAEFAGTGDGRYIFILGNPHITSDGFQEDGQELAASFQLDIIDIFLSKRTRICHIGDFYNFGFCVGFYALNERTVVIVDYDPADNTLRQRLIRIDLGKETAECPLYRGYDCELDSFFHAKTSTGEECAVTVIPSFLGSPSAGIVYPSNPLSATTHKDLTPLITQADAHVRQFYVAGEAGEAKVSTFYPPFFISSTVLGFFIDTNNVDDLIDPMKVLVMDLTSGSVYLQEAKSSSSFPLSIANSKPAYAKWSQASYREVAIISRFRRTGRCWQVGLASLLLSIFRYTVYAAVFFLSWDCRRLSSFCVSASMRMLIMRSQLLEPKTDEFTGFGTLNTRTLEWNEIKASVWNEDETRLIPLREGHFVVSSLTNQISPSRVIGLETLADKKMERFRLIGNPLRIPTLARLSSIAVQKTDRVPSELLEQIAARMIVT